MDFRINFKELEFSKEFFIGQGATGSVFPGSWGGNRVALKQMHYLDLSIEPCGVNGSVGKMVEARKVYNEARRKEVVLEAMKLCHLRHPNVVEFYGISHENIKNGERVCYLLMKLHKLGDLRKMIEGVLNKHEGFTPLSLEDKLRISAGICRGLIYVHKRGIVHRDLRPKNILLCEEKSPSGDRYVLTAKICDFGLSRNAQDETLLNSGGVAFFVATELKNNPQLRGNPAPITDVFSLGMCLWCLFSEKDGVTLPHYLSTNQLPFRDSYDDSSAEGSVMKLAKKCASDDPNERCTIEEVLTKLENLLEEEEVSVIKKRKELEKERERERERETERVKRLGVQNESLKERVGELTSEIQAQDALKRKIEEMEALFEKMKEELERRAKEKEELKISAKKEKEAFEKMKEELERRAKEKEELKISAKKEKEAFEKMKEELDRRAKEKKELKISAKKEKKAFEKMKEELERRAKEKKELKISAKKEKEAFEKMKEELERSARKEKEAFEKMKEELERRAKREKEELKISARKEKEAFEATAKRKEEEFENAIMKLKMDLQLSNSCVTKFEEMNESIHKRAVNAEKEKNRINREYALKMKLMTGEKETIQNTFNLLKKKLEYQKNHLEEQKKNVEKLERDKNELREGMSEVKMTLIKKESIIEKQKLKIEKLDNEKQIIKETLSAQLRDMESRFVNLENLKNDIERRSLSGEIRIKLKLRMAHILHYGLEGENINDKRAISIYKEIESEGEENLDGCALYNLGLMYEEGYGVERDQKKADEYYGKAAQFYSNKNVDDLEPIDWSNMGEMYRYGDGLKKDLVKAVSFLKRAVARKNLVAMFNIGMCYQNGTGVEQSDTKAFEFYSQFPDDLPSTANVLGFMYRKGLGVDKDEKRGFDLYLLAARRGHRVGIYNVGVCYERGYSVEKNVEEAKKWYRTASELGDVDAEIKLKELRIKGKLRMAHNLHYGLEGENINNKRAISIYKEIESEGEENLDGCALYNLGLMYEKGYGVEKDKKKANEYYGKAAQFYSNKNVDDLEPIDWNNMGEMYRFGDGFKKDLVKAVSFLKRAVARGNLVAIFNIGMCYRYGKGVEQSDAKAFEFFSQFPDDLPYTTNVLGFMYRIGLGVDKDEKRGFNLYLQAARRGNCRSMYNVGACYESGYSVEKDVEEAKKWYKKASELGFADAEIKLKELRIKGKLRMAHILHYGLEGENINNKRAFSIYKEIESEGEENLDGCALYNLGLMYEWAYGVEKDQKKADEYYGKTVQFYSNKNVDDLEPIDWNNMGQMYRFGDGFKKDLVKAVSFLKRAVARKNLVAMYNIGRCYRNGTGVEKSDTKAFEYYSRFPDDLPKCINMLGLMYRRGLGVDLDEKRAFDLYLQAARRGERTGMHNVGVCYEYGYSVEKSVEEAKKWYRKASELAYAGAEKRLKELETT